jgi:uncharacterized membrane protein
MQLVLVVLLGLSVVTNFFLLGFIARGGGGEAPGVRFMINQLGGAYPQEVRAEFRKIMREQRPRTRAALGELRAARQKLAAAANAQPFDDKAVDEAMRGVREATTGLQQLIQEYLLTALRNVKAKEG